MKKAVLVLSVMMLTITTNAQWFLGKTIRGNGNVITKTRDTKDYDAIKVSGFFDVNLVKGNEGKIIVKAESNLLDYIITEVEGDELIIKLKKGTNINTKKGIYITVPFQDIDAITLNGSGDVTGDDVVTGKKLEVKLSGSGDMKLALDVQKVTSKLSGSGDMTLKGNANFLDTTLVGSGDFNSKDLRAKEAEVNVTGSGDSSVFVTDKINAKVIGSGDIVFYGNPEIENTKVIGSGDITGR